MRNLVALLVCLPLLAAAHPWHDGTPTLTKVDVESVLARLEEIPAALVALEVPPVIDPNSSALAMLIAYGSAAGGFNGWPEQTEPVLAILNALRSGVIQPDGTWAQDADLFTWFDRVNPADAAVAAPFLPRLVAWRDRMREVLE
jgi:hypothetical protein